VLGYWPTVGGPRRKETCRQGSCTSPRNSRFGYVIVNQLPKKIPRPLTHLPYFDLDMEGHDCSMVSGTVNRIHPRDFQALVQHVPHLFRQETYKHPRSIARNSRLCEEISGYE